MLDSVYILSLLSPVHRTRFLSGLQNLTSTMSKASYEQLPSKFTQAPGSINMRRWLSGFVQRQHQCYLVEGSRPSEECLL